MILDPFFARVFLFARACVLKGSARFPPFSANLWSPLTMTCLLLPWDHSSCVWLFSRISTDLLHFCFACRLSHSNIWFLFYLILLHHLHFSLSVVFNMFLFHWFPSKLVSPCAYFLNTWVSDLFSSSLCAYLYYSSIPWPYLFGSSLTCDLLFHVSVLLTKSIGYLYLAGLAVQIAHMLVIWLNLCGSFSLSGRMVHVVSCLSRLTRSELIPWLYWLSLTGLVVQVFMSRFFMICTYYFVLQAQSYWTHGPRVYLHMRLTWSARV